MSLSVEIEDGRGGTKNKVGVTSRGQLIVAPIEFSSPLFTALDTISTAFNYAEPRAGKQLVITGYIISAGKSVSNTDGAEITIIEADAIDTITATKILLVLNIARSDSQAVTGLNILTTAGKWINASTDDATINLTLLGYFVNIE